MSDWLPFSRSIDEALGMLPRYVAEFSGDVSSLQAKTDHELVSQPPTVFGLVTWIFANGEAIQLVTDGAISLGHPPPVQPLMRRCSRFWRQVLDDRREALRYAANLEFRQKTIAKMRQVVANPVALLDRPDFEHILADLDVFWCFCRAVDREFPDLRIPEALSPHLEQLQTFIATELLPAIRAGKQPGALPWPHEALEDLKIPWLPSDFWWRHLSFNN